MKIKNFFLKKMFNKFLVLAILVNLVISITFQNSVQAVGVTKNSNSNKIPVILIHGRTDNSQTCWGATNYIKEGMNDKFNIQNKKDYTDISKQFISGIKSDDKNLNDTQLACKLKGLGYTENKDLFVFNYPNIDFIGKNSHLLQEYIENLKKKYGYKQFDLIGYSMGGLVARFYIENLNGSNNIRKLISIDTPHWGTYSAYFSYLIPGNNLTKKLPCDVDLQNDSKMFGGNYHNMLLNNDKREKYINYKGKDSDGNEIRNQTSTLEYTKANINTQYYFIASINYWNEAMKLKNDSSTIVELVGKDVSIDNVNNALDNWDKNNNEIYENNQIKSKSISLKQKLKLLLLSKINDTSTNSLGDDVVNLKSQLGITNDKKNINTKKVSIYIEPKNDTLTNHSLLNILHGKAPHISAVINKTVEYLNERDMDNKVTFADKNLEQGVRNSINKPTGDLYKSDVNKITHLSLENQNIKDISGIENLTGLDSIDLSYNKIKDISSLKKLKNLTLITLRYNQIKDISPVKGLTNLKTLDFCGNQIKDVNVLKWLTNLPFIELSGNQIKDISPLKGLSNLKYLDLRDNQIKDASPIKGLTNLYVLYLTNNQIKDIGVLKNLTNLSGLYLRNNQIKDISPLKGLSNLKYLDLSYNQIKDISPLKGLSKLGELALSDAQISDISVLKRLTNLYVLYLTNNQIKDIGVLKNLTNLSELYLRNNQIKDISVLKGLTNLNSLDLGNNQIKDISPLKGLIKLYYLYLDGNQIKALEPIKNLPNLMWLDLDGKCDAKGNKTNDISQIQ